MLCFSLLANLENLNHKGVIYVDCRAELANALPDLHSPALYNWIAEMFPIQRQRISFENLLLCVKWSSELFLCLRSDLVFWFGCSWQQKRHVAAAPPAGVRRMERNRRKPVGWDKGGLTEHQTEGTGTTTIQMRRKHNTHDPESRSPGPDPCSLS